MSTNWHAAGTLSDISDDQPLSASIEGKEVGVYLVGDKYYALEDVCPHAYALLSQGFVEGEEIECPLHGAKFHIPSGRCTKEPGGRDLKCYPVRVEGDTVLVGVE
jgi:3-phenylpropionate/trans-cinnamate dioxygenase ferredoxin component